MNKHGGPAAVGGSSLLVIFSVLCLVVFSLLSLSTVQADGRLSRASAQSVAAYYEADCRAEEILARLRGGEIPAGVALEDGRFCFECPVSETQVLLVSGVLKGDSYTILQWQTVSVTDGEEENDMPGLWDGTM